MHDIDFDDPAFLKAIMEAASARGKVTAAVEEGEAMNLFFRAAFTQMPFAQCREHGGEGEPNTDE